MEAKDSLSKILEALIDLGTPVQKDFLLDFICGRDNEEIEEKGQTDLETFGILQGEEEALLLVIVKEAVKKEFITFDGDTKTYTFTPAGKKFQKKPKSFVVSYDDDEDDEDASIDDSISELMEEIEADVPSKKAGTGPTTSKKSSLKILLIQAIDRKKALDDFAESQGQDFNDILDELESIIQGGTHIDIDYFLEEVFTEDNIDELMEFYEENDGNLDKAILEFEDAYSPEELRLLRIKYLTLKR